MKWYLYTVNHDIYVATNFHIFNELIVSLSGCQDPYLLTDTLQSLMLDSHLRTQSTH